jgi:hypothetical protein
MSDQAYLLNPKVDRMACAGNGFQLPRLTTTQRVALSTDADDQGLVVFDTDELAMYCWDGSAWFEFATV